MVSMEIPSRKLSLHPALYITALELAACVLAFSGRALFLYFPAFWGSPHAINFLAAWIPAILSILVAFVPDRELEVKRRIAWRVGVIFCGVFYSVILFHQQVLMDKTNTATNQALLEEAAKRANDHADKKFDSMQQQVGTLGGQVSGLGQQVDQTSGALAQSLQAATTNLGATISKVGRPDPPIAAKLALSLWDEAMTTEHPILAQVVSPDKDGNVPVQITFANISETTAEAIDIWVQICDACSFAKEPDGFEKLPGSSELTRHRSIGSLNPGVFFQKTTLVVKSPGPFFQVGFRYSCKACGGKIAPMQLASITQGITPIKQP